MTSLLKCVTLTRAVVCRASAGAQRGLEARGGLRGHPAVVDALRRQHAG